MDKLDSTLRELLFNADGAVWRNPSSERRLQTQRRHGGHDRHRDAPQAAARRTAHRPGLERDHRAYTNDIGEAFTINEYFAASRR